MIEICCEGVRPEAQAQALAEKAILAALAHEGKSGGITLLFTDDEGIRAINRDFRHIDRSTDVLSFPAWEGEALAAPPDGYLGDIAISLETARRQAEAYGHSLSRELCFLSVHGTLHLLGYDHMEEAARAHMFALQEEILERMGETR